MVIEEEEGNFRETCIITSRNERNVEEEAEQADDERSGPLTIEETEPGTSLAADQETEDKDETISSTSTQNFDREKVEREFINLASHYQQIGEKFQETGGRSTTYEETTTSDQLSKNAYSTYDQN